MERFNYNIKWNDGVFLQSVGYKTLFGFNQKGTGQNTTWSLYSGLEFLLIGDAPFKKLDAQTKTIEVSNIKIYSWYGSYYN